MAKIEVACKHCEKMFLTDEARLKHGRGQTCSRACQYASMKRRTKLNCVECGIEFELTEAQARNRGGNSGPFCSIQCQHNSPEWRTEIAVSILNSEKAQKALHEGRVAGIVAKQSPEGRAAQSIRSKEIFEDAEYRARWEESIRLRSESPEWLNSPHFQKGEAHPRYTGGKVGRELEMARYDYKKWRTEVFTRDDFTCQECGKRGCLLAAHHIQEWAKCPELRYEVSNGVTLCESCHDLKHGKVKRPKTFKCVDCGQAVGDKKGRSKYCKSCSGKRGYAKSQKKD